MVVIRFFARAGKFASHCGLLIVFSKNVFFNKPMKSKPVVVGNHLSMHKLIKLTLKLRLLVDSKADVHFLIASPEVW